jgi:hypothetical protein
VDTVDIGGDHKGHIKGTGSLYQGLRLNVGTHTFTLDTNLTAGSGILFVRDAVSGEYLVRLPLRWGDKPQSKVTFALTAPADLELGVELTESGEILMDNASVKTKREEAGTTTYPDRYTEDFESRNHPTFDYSGGTVTEEDGNNVLKVDNPGGSPKAMTLHEKQKTFDLRFHLKITEIGSTVDGNVGVTFSRTDGNNCYFFEYNSVLKYIQLRSFVGGAPAVLFNIPRELKTGEWYQIGLRMQNGKLEVYIDGEKAAEAETKANLRGTLLTITAYYTGYCMDNITLAPAGELDMTEKISLKPAASKGYTLTFNAGGGTPIPESLLLNEGAEIPAVAAPTLEGYEFSGWAVDGEIVDLTAFKMPARNLTRTAVWSLLPSETRPPEAETQPDPETTPADSETTPDGQITDPVTDSLDPAETEPLKKGCRSVLDLSALLLILGGVVLAARKRREHE